MMNIAIFASIGSGNIGDELILKNEVKILEEQYSRSLGITKNRIQFTVFTYDIQDSLCKASNLVYREYFPIAIKNPKNIFRNIKNFVIFVKTILRTDLVVIGGGGIFYDNEYQNVGNPLKQWLFRIGVAKLLKKKIEIFRVSIDIKNKNNLSIIKKIFSKVDNISVRDSQSFSLLTNIGIKSVSIIHDPVFFDNYISNNKSDKKYLENTLNKRLLMYCLQSKNLNIDNVKKIIDNKNNSGEYKNISGKTFGISLRKLKVDNYFENIFEILDFIIDKKGSIIFIPHSFHKTDEVANDYVFLNKLYEELERKYSHKISQNKVKISICKSMDESYQIYKEKRIDVNLAQRLHSIILSQVYGIEFIGISYSKKTDEVLKILSKKD